MQITLWGTQVKLVTDVYIPFVVQVAAVLIAAALAFLPVRWAFRKQRAADRADEGRRNAEKQAADDRYLKELYKRARLELRDNKNLVDHRLTEAAQDRNMFPAHRAYLNEIVNAFRFTAYQVLLDSGLMRNLPQPVIQGLSSAFDLLEDLRNMVRMDSVALPYLSTVANKARQTTVIENTITYTQTVKNNLKWDCETIDKHDPYKVAEDTPGDNDAD